MVKSDCTVEFYFFGPLLGELKKNIDKGTKNQPTLVCRGILLAMDHWADEKRSLAFLDCEHGVWSVWIKPDEDNAFLDTILLKRDKELEDQLETIKIAMHKIVDPLAEQKTPLNTSQLVIYTVVSELLKISEDLDIMEEKVKG